MSLAYERIGAGRIRSPEETGETRKRIRAFWHRCEPAANSPVSRYLARRGLPWLTKNPSIRYRPECRHPSGAHAPAMIALIWDAGGDVCAVHRTFLNPDGSKADLDPVKASWGSFAGGAVRLDPGGSELVVAEGIETAAAAGFILGLPAWSAIACGNLGWKLQLPPTVTTVTIATDNDVPGRRAAAAAARRWRAEGRAVRTVQPDASGRDFSDLHQARLMRRPCHAG
jgi:putative DNA primase/helicase